MHSTAASRSTSPSQLLQYLPAHRVLICKECRYAIQPSAISRHLKDLHHIYRSERQELIDYTKKLDLADPADAVLPSPQDPPVSLLPTENGLACAAAGCTHLCVTTKRMKSHWATAHNDLVGSDCAQWRPVILQTFFRGNQLKYFIVRGDLTPPPSTPNSFCSESSCAASTKEISTVSGSDIESEVVSDEHQCCDEVPHPPAALASNFDSDIISNINQVHNDGPDSLVTSVSNFQLEVPSDIHQCGDEIPNPTSLVQSQDDCHPTMNTLNPPCHWTADEVTLFQHFLHHTNFSLGSDEGTREVWRAMVPPLAFQFDFLKHGILACAALHLAQLQPEHKLQWQMKAACLQGRALPSFREAVAVPTPENCNALLAFSQLLIVHCFASEQQDEDLLLVGGKDDSGLPEWLQVVRCSCSMFESVWDVLSTGILQPLIEQGMYKWTVEELQGSGETEYSRRLSELLFQLPRFGKDPLHPKLVAGYASPFPAALLELSAAFAKAKVATDAGRFSLWTAVHLWPARVSTAFLQQMQDRDPIALVLLAHYCILLEPLEEQWFMTGFRKRLLMRIHRQLDEEWRPWLQWPFAMAGLEA